MIGAVLVFASVGFLAGHLASSGLFLARLWRRPAAIGPLGQPRVTLLRPVCGLDQFDAETLSSSFDQTYPNYEIIFCAPSETDPVVPLVRQLIADNPASSARLLIGLDAISGNPKLNNLYKGWRAADADWICMTDSNLLLPPDYLSILVASWGPDTGLVSCPPIGIRPDGLGGSLECAFLNSNQARLQFASDSIGLGFAQGKTLFWNRAMLERAGGLAVLGRHLAEDVTATKITRAAGHRVTLTPLPFAQPIGVRSLMQVWDRQLRWSRVRRDGFPWIFGAELTNGAMLPAGLCLAAILVTGTSLAMLPAFLALWYLAEVILLRAAGWPSGWRDILALPLRDVMMPLIWAATFLRRDIEWRGTAMSIPQNVQPAADALGHAQTEVSN